MNRRAFLVGAASCCGGLAAVVSPAEAEMPWSRYLAMREQAPEVLRVTVASVSETSRDEEVRVGDFKYRQKASDVIASARIDAVMRSASRLSPGGLIEIRYRIVIKDTGLPDVFPPRLLKAKESLTVYLQKSGESYALAAMKASFESGR